MYIQVVTRPEDLKWQLELAKENDPKKTEISLSAILATIKYASGDAKKAAAQIIKSDVYEELEYKAALQRAEAALVNLGDIRKGENIKPEQRRRRRRHYRQSFTRAVHVIKINSGYEFARLKKMYEETTGREYKHPSVLPPSRTPARLRRYANAATRYKAPDTM